MTNEPKLEPGDRVRFTPDFADLDPDEVFTVSDRYENGRFWIADEKGSGWYVREHMVVKVDEE